MSRKKYTKEHIEYLRKIAPGRYSDEITEMFNKKFKMNVTESAIKTLKERHKIQSNVPKNRMQYTQEQLDYLKELATQGFFNAEITRRFNEKFGTNKSERAIQNIRNKYKIYTSARYYWPKGHVPWNKGKKGLDIGGKETQFKKGNIPQSYRPVGSERVNADGYTEVKVADPSIWEPKHKIVWEQHHGRQVPEGYVVIFGDRNKSNFDPENLLLVSRAQLVRMNQRGLIKSDAELTKTGMLIADILNKVGERKRETKSKRR